MNRVKDALKGFWTRARGLGGRKRGRGGDEGEKKAKARGDGSRALWRLIPLGGALAASVVVFAILMNCEYGAYVLPPFGAARCDRWSEEFDFLSTSAGVGFLVFLMLEVVTVILAQMWIDRQRDRAERRAEMTEIARMAEAAMRMAEVTEQARREDAERAERRAEMVEQARREDVERAERRAEIAEQARREDVERAERQAEAAERRELRLIELIESLKNGKDDGAE